MVTRLIIFLAFFLFSSIAVNFYQFSSNKAEVESLEVRLQKQKQAIDFYKDEADKAERIARRRLEEIEVIEAKRQRVENQYQRLKNQNENVKTWADTPIPYALRRMLNKGRNLDSEKPASSASVEGNESEPPEN